MAAGASRSPTWVRGCPFSPVSCRAIGGLRPTPEMEQDLPGVWGEGASETLFIMGPISDTARRCALWKRPDGTLSGILAGPPGW